MGLKQIEHCSPTSVWQGQRAPCSLTRLLHVLPEAVSAPHSIKLTYIKALSIDRAIRHPGFFCTFVSVQLIDVRGNEWPLHISDGFRLQLHF